MTTVRSRLIGFAATIALVAVVAGVPWLLTAWGTDLIPDHLTPAGVRDALLRPDDGTLALGVITAVAWLAWLVIAVSVVVELIATLRGIPAPRLPGLALPQWGAHHLIAAAALLFLAAPLGPCPSPLVLRRRQRRVVPSPVKAAAGGVQMPAASRTIVTDEPDLSFAAGRGAAARTHVVRTGDTLWALAERYLGDGRRFGEIARLNADILDGRPNFLRPGMRLHIPTVDDRQKPRTVIVERGDTLSGIAARELGDPDRYHEIAKASRHITQPGGHHLTDPDVIDIGWKLHIPGNDTKQNTRNHRSSDNHQPATRKTAKSASPSPTDRPGDRPTTAQPTPSTPAPTANGTTTPATSVPATTAPEEGSAPASGWVTPGWLLTGLTGGGVILAGGLALLRCVAADARSSAADGPAWPCRHPTGVWRRWRRRSALSATAPHRRWSSSTMSSDVSARPAPPPARPCRS